MSKKRVGEMSAPTWMLESIRNGEYSKIVYDDTEYVLLKHGHWVYVGHGWAGESILKCSMCGHQTPDDGNYCSNCGAKMDEVEDGDISSKL